MLFAMLYAATKKGETHGTDGNPDLQIVTQNEL